jgi:hypothetical protein
MRPFSVGCRLRGAVEKADAEMLFQFRDAGGGDGGRAALIAGGRTHAAQFIDTHEHSDVVHIGHGGRPILCRDLKVIGHLKD